MTKAHHYEIDVKWTGNTGQGTSTYTAYQRTHEISAPGKPVLPASSDPAFRGDPSRYNPEDLLVASLCACHMLWYLHLCAREKIVVIAYRDRARGEMIETTDGGGRFSEVVLRPHVVLAAGADPASAHALHETAHQLCFIAKSVNFPVRCEPVIEVGA